MFKSSPTDAEGLILFFFSSRRRHTRSDRDWSSDVCSSDLARWARDLEGFWAEAGEAIHWSKRWDRVLDSARAPFYRWFPGATVNTCENALDWHVEHGRADQPALIYDSPVTGTIKTFTYRELRDAVARFAG